MSKQVPDTCNLAIPRSTRRWRIAGLQVSGTCLLLALSACSLSIGSQGVDFETHGKSNDTVELAERRRFDAMVAQDVAKLEPMLAEELYYGHSTGKVENKPQFLESIRSGSFRYHAIEVKHVDVRLYDETAILTGLVHVRVAIDGKPLETDLRYSDAYVRRDGRWQLVAWQSVRVP